MSQEPSHFATEPIESLVPKTLATLAVDAGLTAGNLRFVNDVLGGD